jgi:hypothetical protein
MNNVRLWEEGGRRVTLYEGGEGGAGVALIHIYIRQDRGRVSMWISDRRSALYMGVSGQRASVSRGTAHRTRLLGNLVLAVRLFV